MNSLNSNEPRRKSTSSVPPSEKSDSSDLDSVHSLPIESTSNRMHNTSSSSSSNIASQIQPQSYADIARIMNSNKSGTITSPPIDKMDKWPVVSSGSIITQNLGNGNGNNNSTNLMMTSCNETLTTSTSSSGSSSSSSSTSSSFAYY